MKAFFYILCIVTIGYGCKKHKHTGQPLPEPEVITPKQDSIYFVVVNRFGYKRDSVTVGRDSVRYLAGICINTIYYNVKTNIGTERSACYSRNYQSLLLTDSIVPIVYPVYINSQYNIQVELVWTNKITGKYTQYGRGRDVQYQLKVNDAGNDTIKTAGNKVVKFVWPDDTASGRFFKVYDLPGRW